jgi:DNA-binding NarL/FixJ family response regulator
MIYAHADAPARVHCERPAADSMLNADLRIQSFRLANNSGNRHLMKIRVRPFKCGMGEQIMTNLGQVKVTPRDQQVMNLLVQGCSNKEIGDQLNISPSTVKQHLRMLFVRAGIVDGRKRVKLARSVHEGDSAVMTPCAGLNLMESQISILVWEGLTNREIGKIVGTSEQMIKNHLRSAFDKLGVWSRLELAMYMASGGGKGRLLETSRRYSPGTIDRSTLIPDMA